MLFFAILALIGAIALSSTAGFFSVFGLVSLFSAMTIPVAIMGGALEFGKIAAATWLHHNWRNPKVTKMMRGYLIFGIVILMLITSTGIFGFLSAGHIEAAAPAQALQIKVDRDAQQISSEQTTIDRANIELKSLDKSLDVYFNNDKATTGLKARKSQESERATIDETIKSSQKKIDQLNDDLATLKSQQSESTEKLGPIKYVAELIFTDYQSNIDKAVRIVILLIIFVFDPMAIALIICSSISFSDYFEQRKQAKKEKLVVLSEKKTGHVIIHEYVDPVIEEKEEDQQPIQKEEDHAKQEIIDEETSESEDIIDSESSESKAEQVSEEVSASKEESPKERPDGIMTKHLDPATGHILPTIKEVLDQDPNAPFIPNEKFHSDKAE